MDNIFKLTPHAMWQQLEDIEDEMKEAYYPDESRETVTKRSEKAKACLQYVFGYMKKQVKPKACTISDCIETLYRIAATGEYSFLQPIDEIGYKENALKELDCEDISYAINLLRYYYLIKVKAQNKDPEEWEDINKNAILAHSLDEIGEITKEEKLTEEVKELYPQEKFIPDLIKHMDKYMVGQMQLKKKLCSAVYQFKYCGLRSNILLVGPSGCGKNHVVSTLASFEGLDIPVVTYDCSALTPTGFSGADVSDIFAKVRSVVNKGHSRYEEYNGPILVYLDELDKILTKNTDSHGENVNSFVQHALLSALAGTETIKGIDTSKVMFIMGGAFGSIDELEAKSDKRTIGFSTQKETIAINASDTLREKIMAIGGQRELLGRIQQIVKMQKLTKDELRKCLLDPAIGAFPRKRSVYEAAGMKLNLEEDVIDAIVDLVIKEDAGVRSVTNIINELADDEYFFDMYMGGYDTMTIHKGMLYGEPPIMSHSRDKAIGINRKTEGERYETEDEYYARCS